MLQHVPDPRHIGGDAGVDIWKAGVPAQHEGEGHQALQPAPAEEGAARVALWGEGGGVTAGTGAGAQYPPGLFCRGGLTPHTPRCSREPAEAQSMSRVRAPPQDALQVSRAWTTTVASISATGGSSWPVVSPQPITWHRDPGRSTRFRWGNGVGRTERVRRAGVWSWRWERRGDRDGERDGDRQRGRNKQGANDNDTLPWHPPPRPAPAPDVSRAPSQVFSSPPSLSGAAPPARLPP